MSSKEKSSEKNHTFVNEHLLCKAYEESVNVKTVVIGCKETSDPEITFNDLSISLYTTGDLWRTVQKHPGHLKCCL